MGLWVYEFIVDEVDIRLLGSGLMILQERLHFMLFFRFVPAKAKSSVSS